VTAWDVSEFDFGNNWLQYRQDLSGNRMFYSFRYDNQFPGWGYSQITKFQWGKPSVNSNTIENSWIFLPNAIGEISNNILVGNSYLYEFSIESGTAFSGNYLNNSTVVNSTINGSASRMKDNIMNGAAVNNISLIGSNISFKNNNFYSGSVVSQISAQSFCTIENNILENGAQIIGITAGANCSIGRNKIGQGATLGGGTTMGDYAEFENNFISNNGQISGITIGQDGQIKNNYVYSASILDITAGTDFIMSNNILESGASITNISALDEVSVSYNKLSANSSIGYLPLLADTARIQFLSLASDSRINNKSFDTGVAITNKIIQFISDDTETYTSNIEGYRSQPGFSDIPGTIDITGLTTLDCTAAWAQYRGIYNIASGNATEAIDTITNPPMLFPFTIRPEAGLVLTITGTAYAGIGAGQIALKAASYTLDGDKGEYIVLEIDPLGTGALIEKQVVNGLI
jgi:hypothetical protein